MIKRTWLEMGMPVTVCIADDAGQPEDIAAVADLLAGINERFSTYRADSEVSRLNAGQLQREAVSPELDAILRLCDETRTETDGYFNIERAGGIDPSGLVKGWAIQQASDLLFARSYRNYFVDGGGDVQAVGCNNEHEPWRIGIRNPFNREQNVKVLAISDCGVATSGTAIRGPHIWDPVDDDLASSNLVSLTVIGPSVYEADRMATAAFAMGRGGIGFIAGRPELEGYAISADGIATYTEGFDRYVR
jgi:FAD:protein FMN transferase